LSGEARQTSDDPRDLARQVQHAHELALREGATRLLRVCVELGRLDPWLLCAPQPSPLPWALWDRPADQTTFAALGVAAQRQACGPQRAEALQQACSRWLEQGVLCWVGEPPPVAPPWAWGGVAFLPEPPSGPAWEGWPEAELVVPSLLLARRAQGPTVGAVTVEIGPARDPSTAAQTLSRGLEHLRALARRPPQEPHAPPSLSAPSGVPEDSGERLRWEDQVERACDAFARAEAQKIVLARAITLQGRPDVWRTLANLRARHAGATVFGVGAPGRGAFVGASPELLVQLHGLDLKTQALAGTAPRSHDPAQDEALGRALLDSAKDLREHGFVSLALRETLAPLCQHLDLEPIKLLRLANVQHLETSVRGRLASPTPILELVARLHPTPAVGGWPREAAAEWLRQHEDLARGWYASPVGWVEPDLGGTFAVAIRSAVLREHAAWAFAGAGLVASSHPRKEWDETQHQLRAIVENLAWEEPAP
jgi:isochorismate synthase